MKSNKIITMMVCLVMAVCTMLSLVSPISVKAEQENILFMDEYQISLGSNRYVGQPYWFDLRYEQNQEIMFSDDKWASSYSATSDNNGIVKVSVGDNKINLVGVSAGTTTVRLYRHNGGSKTQAGYSSITVKTPSIKLWGNDATNYGLGLQGSNISIDNRNVSDNYDFKVDKEGLKIYDDKLPTGQILTKVDATKVGTYNLEVIENLNGSKRSMGKYVINVFNTVINKEYEIELGANKHESEVFLKYADKNYDYYLESNVDLYATNPRSFETWVSDYEYETGEIFPQSKYNIYRSSGQVFGRQLGIQKVKVYMVKKGMGTGSFSVSEMVQFAKDNKIKCLGETTVKVVPAKPRV